MGSFPTRITAPIIGDVKEKVDLHAARALGILGGTFDPVHIGHLILAEFACDELGLDAIVLMPAHRPPHKLERRDITPSEDRLAMLERATAVNPRLVVSDLEITRTGISYTVDTL